MKVKKKKATKENNIKQRKISVQGKEKKKRKYREKRKKIY